eukprot:TRINITY_DN686_c0_g1_i1.p1 TRINITY_DN686_c0_g1~~TRINITY_DN686_c0_g1_i1.p1  ORF type:complete len:274 (-),score=62.25 TRINITY_DN686_c0_g1_i1:28-849(-)
MRKNKTNNNWIMTETENWLKNCGRKKKKQLKKKEWEKSLELFREQAKREAAKKIEEALNEKAELERRLKEARDELASKTTHAAVNLEGTEYPKTWVYQNSPYALVDVPKGSDEWNKLEHNFFTGCQNVSEITRIQRNQNKTLWTFYYLRREQIAQKNYKDPNEKFVYHGPNTSDVILKEGFDNREADLNGSLGAGVYFGTTASVANSFGSAKGGYTKKIFYCRVTLGSIGPGQAQIRRAPDPHHSVGSVHGGIGTYAVFDNHQAYPEYVIHFK